LFGTDGPGSQALGDQAWDFGWDTSRDYGSAIPQLYAQFGNEEFSVQAGYFWGLQGYESTDAPECFFYTHSYGFGFGVPNAHSGVLATYAPDEEWEYKAGWVNGWDSWWTNYLNASMFLGGFAWTISEDATLSYYVSAGDFGDGTAKGGVETYYKGSLYSHSIVYEESLGEKVRWALENTYGSNWNGIDQPHTQWYSLAGYFFHDINDCWSSGARAEWFRDDDGFWVASNGAGAGSYYELTLGLNYRPNLNLTIRHELRWDWFTGEGKPFDTRDGGITGTETQQFTFGWSAVFTF
jgi:hypothetical protein